VPFSDYDTKEAMRAATDWLVPSELTGSVARRYCRYDSAGHDDGWSNRMIWMT
jgi:hypothetical protein